VPLTKAGWGKLSMQETSNMLAYQAFLNGATHMVTFAPGGFEKSVKYFTEAVRLQPDYARAHAGLAFAYAELAGISLNPREQVRLAREHAAIAGKLDDTLPELHFAMINIRQYHDWDWPGVEAECQRLIALAPGLAQSYQMHGWALSLLGRFEEGLSELRRAQSMDPNSSTIAGAIAANLTWSGRLDAAREETLRLIQADPATAFGEFGLAQIELLDGDVMEGMRRLELAVGPPVLKEGALGYAYGVAGRRADAERAIARLESMITRDASPAFQIAQVYAGLGDRTRALDWLERAYSERSLWMAWLKVEPTFSALRAEPRFQALLTKMKF
jgi:serine/threonine-protein kinase